MAPTLIPRASNALTTLTTRVIIDETRCPVEKEGVAGIFPPCSMVSSTTLFSRGSSAGQQWNRCFTRAATWTGSLRRGLNRNVEQGS